MDFFHDGLKTAASFELANTMVKDHVSRSLELAAKFGIKHTPAEKELIVARVWDHAQYLLSEHYYPQTSQLQMEIKEGSPSANVPDDHSPVSPADNRRPLTGPVPAR
jgi:hypothetical protein